MVRGERPLEDVQLVGISLSFEENQLKLSNVRQLVVDVHIHDIAQGLLAYHKTAEQLRHWAWAIESFDFVSIIRIDSPFEDVVLEALWDAAFGNHIDQETMLVLNQVVAIS